MLNEENTHVLEDAPAVQGPVEDISKEEVIWAVKSLKSGKAAGPSEATTEMFLSAGENGVCMLLSVFKNVMSDGIPPE